MHRNHLCLPSSHCKALFIYFTFLAAVAITHRNSVHLCISLPHTARHCSSISPFLAAVAITHRNSVHLCLPPSHCKALFIYFTFSSSTAVAITHRNSVHLCLPPSHCSTISRHHCSTARHFISPFLAAVEITHRNSVHLCLPPSHCKALFNFSPFLAAVAITHRNSVSPASLPHTARHLFTSASLPHTARHCSSISPFLAAVAITHHNSVHLCLLPHTARHSAVEITHRSIVFTSASLLTLQGTQQWRLRIVIVFTSASLPHTARHCSSISPFLAAVAITHRNSVHLCLPPLTARHCSSISPFLGSSGVAITHLSHLSYTAKVAIHRISNTHHVVFTSASLPHTARHCSSISPFLAAVAITHRNSVHPASLPHTARHCSSISPFLAAVAITHRNSIHLCLPPSLTLQGTQQWRLRIVIVFTSASLPHTARHCSSISPFLAAVEITHRNSVHLCLPPSHCKALFNYFTFSSSGDYAVEISPLYSHSACSSPAAHCKVFTVHTISPFLAAVEITHRNSVHLCLPSPHTARHCSTISPFLAAVAITHRNSVHLCLLPHTARLRHCYASIFTFSASSTFLAADYASHCSSISPFLAAVAITHRRNSVHLCLPPSHCKALFIYFTFSSSTAVEITHRNSVHLCLPPSHCKALFIYFTFSSSSGDCIVIVFTSASLPHTQALFTSASLPHTARHCSTISPFQQQWRLRIVIVFTSASLPHTARHCSSISPFLAAVEITHRNSVHLFSASNHNQCSPCLHTARHCSIYFTFSSSSEITHRNSVHLCLPPSHCKALFIYFTFSSSSGDYASSPLPPSLTLQGTVQSISPFLAAVAITHRNSVHLPPSLTLQGTQQWRLRIVIVFTSASLPHTARHCSSISPFLAAVEITHRNSVHLCSPSLTLQGTCSPLPPLSHTARHCSSISPFLAAVAITHRNSVHLCLHLCTVPISPHTARLPPSLCKTLCIYFTFSSSSGDYASFPPASLPHTARHCSSISTFSSSSGDYASCNSVHLCLPPHTARHCSSISPFLAAVRLRIVNSVHLCLPPSHCKALFIYFTFSSSSGITHRNSVHLCLPPHTASTVHTARHLFTSASLPHTAGALFIYFTFSSSSTSTLAAVERCSSLTFHCSSFLSAVEITHRNSVHLCLPPSHCKTLFIYFTFSSSTAVEITHRNSVHLCLPPLTLQGTQWRLRIVIVFTSASLPPHTARHCSSISPFLAAVEITHRYSVHLCLPLPHTARHCSSISPFLAAVAITHRNSVHLCLPSLTLQGTQQWRLRIVIVFTSASLPHTARHCSSISPFLAAVEITHRNSVHLCLPPSHCKALFIHLSSSRRLAITHLFTSASLPHTARHCSSISPFLAAVAITHPAVAITHRNSTSASPPSHCKTLFIYFTFFCVIVFTLPPSLTLQGTQQWRLRIVIVFTSASLPHTARHCSTISPFLAAVEITHRNSVHLCLPPSHCKALFIYFTFSSSFSTSASPPSHCKALFIYFTFSSSSGQQWRLRIVIVFTSASLPHTARHCSSISPFLAAVEITHRNSVPLPPSLTLQGTQQWRLRIVIVFTSASLPYTARHCSSISPFLAAVEITHRNSVHLTSLSARHCSSISPFLAAVAITHRNSVHLCLPPSHCKALFIYFTFLASGDYASVHLSFQGTQQWRLRIVIVFTSASLPHTARHCSSISPFLAAVEITHRNSVHLCLPPSHCKALFIYFHLFAAVAITHHSVHLCLPPSHCKGTVHLFHLF
ncbi:unnamed protein product [Acanthosepion pharaonis]|uniref:Uncharacterized protein n=1 Tax=Acanthosepion pharaonis TaxID=158019 RepID=A0A812BFN0_ACAPH|nr:unnamed protein product [Sepia pharaonis]